jgi:hypothetical protein
MAMAGVTPAKDCRRGAEATYASMINIGQVPEE